MKNNILYISILGMSEPLGKSQVLEYIKDLSKKYNMSLYSFEKDLNKSTINDLDQIMNDEKIDWHYQQYSNKYGIFSTVQQIFSSFFEIRKLIKEKNIKVIHARSLIPTVIALTLKKFYNVKVIADIRGFQIDEKAESGRIKKESFIYKFLKYIENTTYKKSDSIVSLTYAAIEHIKKYTNENKITVIPTCANDRVFYTILKEEKDSFKKSLGYENEDKILLHAGAVSNWYDFDRELKVISNIFKKDNSIKYLILNKSEHDFIDKKLTEYSIDKSRVKILEVNFYEMYKYLNIADASIFIVKPTFSKTASAPTKFAENLCCELYSITNNGIGDMNKFFKENKTLGYSFDISVIEQDLDELSTAIINKLENEKDFSKYKETYNKYFSKDMAIQKYSKVYDSMLKENK